MSKYLDHLGPLICFHSKWDYYGIFKQHSEKIQLCILCLNPECLEIEELVLDIDFFEKFLEELNYKIDILEEFHEDILPEDIDWDTVNSSEHICEVTSISTEDPANDNEKKELRIHLFVFCSYCGIKGVITLSPADVIELVYHEVKVIDTRRFKKKSLENFFQK